MLMRPRSLFDKYIVEEKITRVNEIGRQVVEYKPNGEIINGCISQTNPAEVEKYKLLRHEITHVIISKGKIKAKEGDLLIKIDKKYLVQNVEQIADWTNYFVKERRDL